MSEASAVLCGIEDEFVVVCVDRIDFAHVKIIIEMGSRDGPWPRVCGVLSRR
jgi:hypothetical protein